MKNIYANLTNDLTIPFTNKCWFFVSNFMLTFLCERYRTYVIIPYAFISFQQSHSKWWDNICSGTLFSSQKIIWFLSEIFVILPVLKEKNTSPKKCYLRCSCFIFFYICILFYDTVQININKLCQFLIIFYFISMRALWFIIQSII